MSAIIGNATRARAGSPLRSSNASAETALNLILLAIVASFACWLIATRSLDIGTDTSVYANFFSSLANRPVETRLEPGFVYISKLVSALGFGVPGYQATLFGLLMLTVLLSTRAFFRYLGGNGRPVTYLTASAMLLMLSPVFVNSSINAVRQGLASLLVFTALIAFDQRRWWRFIGYALAASLLHFSSALYIAFAPLLYLGYRRLRLVAVFACLLYATGATMHLVGLMPGLYKLVLDHGANANFRSGVRLDFAAFSLFWYGLPFAAAPFVQAQYREKLKQSSALYLVMLLPFFAFGWGYFSNRYLLPAWQAESLVVAALLCFSNIRVLRSPVLMEIGLLVSVATFYFYVKNGIVL